VVSKSDRVAMWLTLIGVLLIAPRILLYLLESL